MYFCYILKSDRSFQYYVGSTNDLRGRLRLHNAGKVKSTKAGLPWRLVHSETFTTLSDARKRELQIKHWKSRKAIERLIGTFEI